MKVGCILCNIGYNCEELADCVKCKGSVCEDCVVFDSGNYYCLDCFEQ